MCYFSASSISRENIREREEGNMYQKFSGLTSSFGAKTCIGLKTCFCFESADTLGSHVGVREALDYVPSTG